jgi:hypothetical protein
MWAEAFRSVEDIQALIALGKRQPKQQMMATYYRCVSVDSVWTQECVWGGGGVFWGGGVKQLFDRGSGSPSSR